MCTNPGQGRKHRCPNGTHAEEPATIALAVVEMLVTDYTREIHKTWCTNTSKRCRHFHQTYKPNARGISPLLLGDTLPAPFLDWGTHQPRDDALREEGRFLPDRTLVDHIVTVISATWQLSIPAQLRRVRSTLHFISLYILSSGDEF